jgi:hypothetical protein
MCDFNAMAVPKRLDFERITCKRLETWGARCEGLKWFKKMFPDGTYLAIALAACNNPNWIEWLLQQLSKEY